MMTIHDTSQDPAAAGARPPKPKIGLALGSGVARGWAHIGVIRALTRAGFEPDIIAGTSIGALVGGCYLADKLGALEDFARSLTGRRIFGLLDLSFGGSGIIGGKKLKNALKENLGTMRLEDLPRPFVSVTTELATGHEIWIRDGDLVDGLRASYALPGVFPPVKINRRWLIDGALVNPVPVSVCRAMGARLVIAVNLNADVFGKGSFREGENMADVEFNQEVTVPHTLFAHANPNRLLMRQLFGTGKKTPGMTTVMLSALNIVQDRLARSRLAGDPPDVMIAPRLGHISLLEFDRAAEAIQLGEESIEPALPYLREAMSILA